MDEQRIRAEIAVTLNRADRGFLERVDPGVLASKLVDELLFVGLLKPSDRDGQVGQYIRGKAGYLDELRQRVLAGQAVQPDELTLFEPGSPILDLSREPERDSRLVERLALLSTMEVFTGILTILACSSLIHIVLATLDPAVRDALEGWERHWLLIATVPTVTVTIIFSVVHIVARKMVERRVLHRALREMTTRSTRTKAVAPGRSSVRRP